MTTRDDLAEVLKFSKNESAAGIDWATYVLWKQIDTQFQLDARMTW